MSSILGLLGLHHKTGKSFHPATSSLIRLTKSSTYLIRKSGESVHLCLPHLYPGWHFYGKAPADTKIEGYACKQEKRDLLIIFYLPALPLSTPHTVCYSLLYPLAHSCQHTSMYPIACKASPLKMYCTATAKERGYSPKIHTLFPTANLRSSTHPPENPFDAALQQVDNLLRVTPRESLKLELKPQAEYKQRRCSATHLLLLKRMSPHHLLHHRDALCDLGVSNEGEHDNQNNVCDTALTPMMRSLFR